MKTALIGYTGFVGSNLLSRLNIDDVYRSTTIEEIRGKSYDLVISAGNRADSFRINNEPDVDLAEINGLIDAVADAQIGKLVLVSTCVVYPGGSHPNEDSPLTTDGLTPYGANRLHQEQRFSSLFDTTIVRLPQLYGDSLKKGLIYDLANDYRTEFIRPDGLFQYYDVRKLAADITTVLANNVSSINMASPAISNADVAELIFGRDIRAQQPAEPESVFAQMYTRDMHTKHGALLGGTSDYINTRAQVIEGLREFASTIGTANQGEKA
ncbi:MAG: NAD-dependent epimerase/dehydratase family protein [Mycetocola sp.]